MNAISRIIPQPAHHQRERRDAADRIRAAVQADEELLVADLRGAGREDEVLCLEGHADVVRRQAEGVEARLVEVDHHLALLAAVGPRHLDPLDGREAGAEEVAREVEELLLGERVGVNGPLDDGDVGRAVVDDERRRGPDRELLEKGLRDGRHLGVRHLHLHAGVEEDLGDRDAEEGLALDVLDAATVVVSARSKLPVKRCSISSGGSPAYCQTTAMTGMSISGRMSVGIWKME